MSPAQALYDTLVHPARTMPQVAESGRFLPALVVATAAAVLFAVLAVPRFDFARAAVDALDRRPDSAQMTPHQRQEAVATERKIGAVAGYAGAVLGPTLMALGAAVALVKNPDSISPSAWLISLPSHPLRTRWPPTSLRGTVR